MKTTAYCVRCKAKREYEGAIKVGVSGRRVSEGWCGICLSPLARVLGRD